MKKSILIAAILVMALFVRAQQIPAKSVPAPVMESIKSSFPELTHMPNAPVKWTKAGHTYKASLYEGSANPAKIEIDSLGAVLMVERRVSNEEVPAKAMEYLKSLYKDTDVEIAEVYKISAKGHSTYRTKVIVKPVYIFDSKGQLVTPGAGQKTEPKSK
jgi:hypothetical protein